jgi:hypothetical protein
MPRLKHDPPLPSPAQLRACENRGFLQRVELLDGRTCLARAAWYAPATDSGVVQLIELTAHPHHRRGGHASTVLGEVIAQSRALCKLKRRPLRRLWIAIEQKSQVLARAFLTKHAFHHTVTIPDLMKGQDVLVYVRSFD